MAEEEMDAAGKSSIHTAWLIIPARGGSVGVPRKNLRIVAGVPLIVHSIKTAREVLSRDRVIVITDSEEIADVAYRSGAEVVTEQMLTPPEETLDTKILRNLPMLRNRGASNKDIVLTLQPTSPLTRATTIRIAIQALHTGDYNSVLTVAEDRHLRWRQQDDGPFVPLFSERVNRQSLPNDFRETGGIIAARLEDIEKHGSRVIDPIFVLPVSQEEAIDIDSHADLYVVAHYLTRKRVAVRVDAAIHLGMGHVYRALALVTELARHEVRIFVSEDYILSQDFFRGKPCSVSTVRDDEDFQHELKKFQPDVIILDILDTSADFIAALRAACPIARIVTFEDRGPGALQVDLVVAEFVEAPPVPADKLLTGIEYSLLAPRFELPLPVARSAFLHVTEILVLFGGTDPSGLARRALHSLKRVGFRGHVTVVRGMGAGPLQLDDTLPYEYDVFENVEKMPLLMAQADFAYTSAGRTIVELAATGTPSICLAQNEKELTHTHATESNGVIALGLGAAVTDDELDLATLRMLGDRDCRQTLAHRASHAGRLRRNRRTLAEIFARLGFESFPDL